MVSEQVGRVLVDHAVLRTQVTPLCISRWAVRVMIEYRPNKAGVVRAMARTCHWRYVSIPRCARASSHVTSIAQRRIHQLSICAGI
jgi:hypothetical protein